MSTKTHLSSQPKMPRRSFLRLAVTLFSALWGILALYPVYRYLRPPKTLLTESSVTSVTVGDVGALPVGQGKNFQFGSVPGVIIHTPDGQFHAFNAICTHLGCTVQFRSDMQRIWCACHGGQYSPETGAVLAGPPPHPLEPFNVTVQDGRLVVSRRQR